MFKSLKSFFVGLARSIRLRRSGWAQQPSCLVLIFSAFYIGLKGNENCFSLPPTPLDIDVWAAIVVDGSLITFTQEVARDRQPMWGTRSQITSIYHRLFDCLVVSDSSESEHGVFYTSTLGVLHTGVSMRACPHYHQQCVHRQHSNIKHDYDNFMCKILIMFKLVYHEAGLSPRANHISGIEDTLRMSWFGAKPGIGTYRNCQHRQQRQMTGCIRDIRSIREMDTRYLRYPGNLRYQR